MYFTPFRSKKYLSTYHWPHSNPRPTLWQWKNFIIKYKDFPIPDKASLIHLDDILYRKYILNSPNCSHFIEIKNNKFHITPSNSKYTQLINRNTNYEHFLLVNSKFQRSPHEVAQIRLFQDKFTPPFVSPILHGNKKKVKNYEYLKKTLNETIFKAKYRGMKVNLVEINHVHPNIELIIKHDNNNKYFLSYLSEQDIRFAKYMTPMIGNIPIIVRAITPTNINYSWPILGS